MKNVLITGGTGFFGKSILDYWRRFERFEKFERGHLSITLLSRHGLPDFPLAAFKQLNNLEVKQFLGDVRTFDVGTKHFDYVIHAATPARVDVPDDEMRSIVLEGTVNAIRQAKKCGAEKFMMVSSGGVYGRGFTRPVSEEDEPHPYTVYGKAKLEAERMAVDSGLYTLLPRCFAFVGKHLDRNAHFAIGNFIRDALAGKDIVINGDGSPMRSYMYADDLVEWLFAILERGESGRPYNVGSNQAISILDLAHLVRDTLRSDNRAFSDVKILGVSVPGAANYYVPDVGRAMKELGLRNRVSLMKAIAWSAV